MSLNLIDVANENLYFFEKEGYNEIKFSPNITDAVLYSPEALKELSIEIPDGSNAKVTVYQQDTCECAKRFINFGHTCILNFASAMNEGGGFLGGARAQEECICRESTLFKSLTSKNAEEYYRFNRSHIKDYPMYSDYIIFSPTVEVFRNSNYDLLSKPYTISVITSPAVNKHKARNCNDEMISKCMFQRAEYILKVAVSNKVDNLILGAWGCGVFGNEPSEVAKQFRYLLFAKGYIKCFKNVSFAVYDRSGYNLKEFQKVFAEHLH